jgi:hypothetical protein
MLAIRLKLGSKVKIHTAQVLPPVLRALRL